MQEVLDQVYGFIRGGWRFRWYMHLIAWPLCIAGWVFVYEMPDEYEASARVYVDTQSVLRPLLRGLAVQTDVTRAVEVMTRTLLSRPNLEKIARMTDMDLEAKTPEDMELLLEGLRHRIKFTGGERRSNNLYSISYSNENPDRAKQVVQSLLTLFVETSLGDTRKDSDTAQKFLDEQIKEYETRLLAAETALKEFKQKNIGMMPQQGQEYFEKLRDAMEQLSKAELTYKEAQNRRDELQRQLQGEEPTFGIVAPSPNAFQTTGNPALEARIQALQARLDELLLKYTDKHPDVQAVKETISTLEKQRDDELAQQQQSSVAVQPQGLETNPVYQQLKISLGEAEANVAGLKVRVDQFREEVARLKGAVDTIPEVEAEFKRLNRDYEVNKKNYQELLERRESAKLSEQAEQTSDNVKFRIIDPPFVSSNPVAPNRPLLVSVVLIAGLLAGASFAVFLSQIKPTFDTVRVVTRELGLPVFGSVSRVWTGNTKVKRRAEVLAFGTGGLVLLVLYGAYMAYLIMTYKIVG